MWDRLLLAIDQSDAGQAALSLAVGQGGQSRAGIVVFHVRERSPYLRVPPLETMAEARALADDAVSTLVSSGIDARAVVRSAGQHEVAELIAAAATTWACDAVILGSTRLTGLRRINGSGVRERLVRRTPLPVLVAPPALRCRTRLRTRHLQDRRAVDHR
jgi:nucleotide-binding universal stress UspA family protein